MDADSLKTETAENAFWAEHYFNILTPSVMGGFSRKSHIFAIFCNSI